jgi:hypothetical protein
MSEWLARTRRLAPLLLVLLLAAVLVAAPGIGRWDRDGADGGPAAALLARIDALPPGALALVAFDPDLTTYAEIRPAARAVLETLSSAGLRVAVVSFSPEGRALGAAELARLDGAAAPLDLGFIPGGEAGLVAAVRGIMSGPAAGPVADAIRAGGGGIAAFDLAIVVGGGEIGPRSWVEQVRPRVPGLPIAAIVPAVQRPQLDPYLASGQLAELVAGPDAVAAMVGADDALERRADAVVVGLLAAMLVLLFSGLWPHLARRRTAAGDEDEATA